MALTFQSVLSTFTAFTETKHKKPMLDSSSRKKNKGRSISVVQSIRCNAHPSTETIDKNKDNITRRSGNYSPNIWHFDYIQSLRSDYEGEIWLKRNDKLKEAVKVMLDNESSTTLEQLELIDMLQRLGVSYHFEHQITRKLEIFHKNLNSSCNDTWKKDNLYATALEFRLLRQHGFFVPQEVFNIFKNGTSGDFKASMSSDIVGILSLYEASFHGMTNETILEEATKFTTKHLEEYTKRNKFQKDYISKLVSRALQLPLHWRVPRMEALWFVTEAYKRCPNMNPTLLEFAKLDFNVVQAKHQQELKHVSRWWNDTCFGQKLKFARDRLMEFFIWTVGTMFEPQFGHTRSVLTKVISIIVTIDDVYDVYGTLDELELFTSSVERWDLSTMEQLPDYMKLCFFTLYNSVNEIALETLKEHDVLTIEHQRRVWRKFCKSFLVEAEWYHRGYTPTFQEYLENAYVSASTLVVLMHAYLSIPNTPISRETLTWMETYPSVILQSAMIFRLTDDQGTSSDEIKRGDNPKSIQCHMRDTGVSEEEARKHIKYLTAQAWKQLNEGYLMNPWMTSSKFMEISMNLARSGHWFYQHGDGLGGAQQGEFKTRVLSLIVDPIPILPS